MKKKNSKKSSKQLIAVLAIFAISSVLFASAKENKILFRQNNFIALQEVDGQVLSLALPETVAGEKIVTEEPIRGNGSQVEQPAISNMNTPRDLQIANVGFTANGEIMEGNLQDGFVLYTDRNPNTDYLVQFIDDTITPDPEFLDTPYPLYLTSANLLSSTTMTTTLQLTNYYNNRTGLPEIFLTYLLNALPGSASQNPFAYIIRDQVGTPSRGANDVHVFLADGAKKNILDNPSDQSGSDMTIPGDFPIGTYYIDGPEGIDRVSFKLIIKPITHGSWCSALLGVMRSTTLTNNNVIDVNDDTSIRDLIDTGLISTWYGLGDNANCQESFGPTDEFTETNYDQIDWCAGLLQGITDSIGSKVDEIRYSSMFDLNTDDSIDLSDIGIIATYIGDNDQAKCYTHYGFPAWETSSEKPTDEVPTITSNNGHSNAPKLAIKPVEELPMVLGEKVSNCKIDSAVAGQTEWADGSLIRGCDNKVYRIENQVKRHIVSLKELFKYVGQRINNVTDEIVALF